MVRPLPASPPVGAGFKPALPGAAWEPCNPESIVPAYPVVVPAKAERNPDNPIVVPAKAGTQRGGEGRSETDEASAHPEPVLSPAEGRQAYEGRTPRSRPSRTQRRREGNTRAAMRGKPLGSERIAERKHKEPAPAELSPAERRISENIEAHRHEPDPYGALIGSTTPGRSPPR